MDNKIQGRKPQADICLLLEGTYPYVRGGVSSWVHQIINGFPEYTFSLIFLGGESSNYDEPKYELPENVVHIEIHYMMEGSSQPHRSKFNWSKINLSKDFSKLKESHQYLQNQALIFPKNKADSLMDILLNPKGITYSDMQNDGHSWDLIRDSYQNTPPGLDFNQYFWTVRTMHAPLFVLKKIAQTAPPARVYHAISTGYAGFLGALICRQMNKPFFISEHGIYTKEREIDLSHVEWVPEESDPFQIGFENSLGYYRQLWIRFFRSLGKMSYTAANPIISLYEGNRKRQIEDGAKPERTMVIPNAIKLEKLTKVRRPENAAIPPVLGLVGRIVPIKDIKTFIRAMRNICDVMPEAEGWLVGPVEEDPGYVEECRNMVENMGLENNVKFLGFQRLDEILPKLGLMVLTSISEGQPLVILEAYATGIPVVSTDVGSCREMVEGDSEEDKALGFSGAITSIANPAETAEAVINLLKEENWRKASKVAIKRVEKYYDESILFSLYGDIYQQLLTNNNQSQDKVHAGKGI